MTEYIEREAAMLTPVLPKEYRRYQTDNLDDAYEQGWNDALNNLKNAPAADVSPVVRGRWVPSEDDFDDEDALFDIEEWCDWQCDTCGEDICYDDPMPSRLLPKFCPNCGAKMDGADTK